MFDFFWFDPFLERLLCSFILYIIRRHESDTKEKGKKIICLQNYIKMWKMKEFLKTYSNSGVWNWIVILIIRNMGMGLGREAFYVHHEAVALFVFQTINYLMMRNRNSLTSPFFWFTYPILIIISRPHFFLKFQIFLYHLFFFFLFFFSSTMKLNSDKRNYQTQIDKQDRGIPIFLFFSSPEDKKRWKEKINHEFQINESLFFFFFFLSFSSSTYGYWKNWNRGN